MASTSPAAPPDDPFLDDQPCRPSKPPRSPARLAILVIGLVCGGGFLGYDIVDGILQGRKAAAEQRTKQLAALDNFKHEANSVKGIVKPGDDLNDPTKAKQVDAATDRMVDAAAQVDQQMRPLVKAMMDEFKSIGREIAANNKALDDCGGVDTDTLTSRDVADQRIAAIKQCRDKAVAIVARLDAVPQTIRQALQGSDVPASKIDSFVSSLKQNDRFSTQKRVAQLDVEAYGLMADIVTLLRDEFGHWKSTDAHLSFSGVSESATAQFKKLVKETQAVSKESQELRAKLQEK